MADLRLTRDSEMMVAQVEGQTDEGFDFVDAYLPSVGQMSVVDAGRIIVSDDEIPLLLAKAAMGMLTVSDTRQR